MSTLTYWTGSVSQDISGPTPFGIYDNDSTFQSDGSKSSKIRRLGYPIIDVELIDVNFCTCFEEAVSEYSCHTKSINLTLETI